MTNFLLPLYAYITTIYNCCVRTAIGNGGPIGYILALVAVLGPVRAALDVSMDIKVAKEDEHDHHVAGQEVLAPDGEVTAHA